MKQFRTRWDAKTSRLLEVRTDVTHRSFLLKVLEYIERRADKVVLKASPSLQVFHAFSTDGPSVFEIKEVSQT